jgi:hypothetical protein
MTPSLNLSRFDESTSHPFLFLKQVFNFTNEHIAVITGLSTASVGRIIADKPILSRSRAKEVNKKLDAFMISVELEARSTPFHPMIKQIKILWEDHVEEL